MNLKNFVALSLTTLAWLGGVGCSTAPTVESPVPSEFNPPAPSGSNTHSPERQTPGETTLQPKPAPETNEELAASLGMKREFNDLGFEEKTFNPCTIGAEGSSGCGDHYFTVVNFQLFCRDSEGSASEVPLTEPIASDNVTWELGGTSGTAPTNPQGYGHFSIVSQIPSRDQRLILRIGPQFIGLNVSEVTKIVLPANYCHSDK